MVVSTEMGKPIETIKVIAAGKDKVTTEAGTALMEVDSELAKMMGALRGSDGKLYHMVESRPQSQD